MYAFKEAYYEVPLLTKSIYIEHSTFSADAKCSTMCYIARSPAFAE